MYVSVFRNSSLWMELRYNNKKTPKFIQAPTESVLITVSLLSNYNYLKHYEMLWQKFYIVLAIIFNNITSTVHGLTLKQ